MLTIRRKFVALLVSMMLVRFYGNLGLRVEGLVRQKKERLLIRTFFKFIRNVIASLYKFILGVVAIVIGLAWTLIWGFIYWLFCWSDFPEIDCLSAHEIKLGLGCFVGGIVEIVDIKRTIRSKENLGHLRWHALMSDYPDRRLRQLSMDNKAKAQTGSKLDCKSYTEKNPQEVLAAVLQESFDINRKLHKYVSDANYADLYMRQGFLPAATTPLTHDQRVKLDKESWDNLLETVKQKTLLYRSRIKRTTCAAVKSFNDKLDLEINPERWTGDKKTKYDKLKAETTKGDVKKGAEAQQKIVEMYAKYDPKSEDSKNAIAEMLMKELEYYGLTKHDLSSQFTTNVLKVSLTESGQEKLLELKKKAPNIDKSNKDLESIQVGMKKVDEANLEDDSDIVASEVNTIDDPQEEEKKQNQI